MNPHRAPEPRSTAGIAERRDHREAAHAPETERTPRIGAASDQTRHKPRPDPGRPIARDHSTTDRRERRRSPDPRRERDQNRRRPNAESAGDDANFGSKPIAPIHNQRLPTRSIRSRTRRVDQPVDAKKRLRLRSESRAARRPKPSTNLLRPIKTERNFGASRRREAIQNDCNPSAPRRSSPLRTDPVINTATTHQDRSTRSIPTRAIQKNPAIPTTNATRRVNNQAARSTRSARSARSTPVEPNHQNPTVRASIPLRTSTPKQPHAPDQRDPFQSDPIIKIPTARGKNDRQPDTPARAGSHRTGTPASLRIRP